MASDSAAQCKGHAVVGWKNGDLDLLSNSINCSLFWHQTRLEPLYLALGNVSPGIEKGDFCVHSMGNWGKIASLSFNDHRKQGLVCWIVLNGCPLLKISSRGCSMTVQICSKVGTK